MPTTIRGAPTKRCDVALVPRSQTSLAYLRSSPVLTNYKHPAGDAGVCAGLALIAAERLISLPVVMLVAPWAEATIS